MPKYYEQRLNANNCIHIIVGGAYTPTIYGTWKLYGLHPYEVGYMDLLGHYVRPQTLIPYDAGHLMHPLGERLTLLNPNHVSLTPPAPKGPSTQ